MMKVMRKNLLLTAAIKKLLTAANKALLTVALAFVLLFSLYGCANAGDDVNPDEIDWSFYNARAAEFIAHTASGDFEAAREMFDTAMTRLVDAEALQEIWLEVTEIAGDYQEIDEIINEFAQGYYISGVLMRCENAGYAWNVVFDKEGLVAGLNSGGTVPLSSLTGGGEVATEPVARDGFTDYPVVIGEGAQFPVNGMMSIPDDAEEPVPAVVIISGSGPNDMDGNIGMVAIYRDMADYLAANGIATIRFDKQGVAHGAQLAQIPDFTVFDEYEDALAAAEMLKTDPRVDAGRVYLLGHSLGAMVAPRIQGSGGDFAGLILMAGSPRFLGDILVDQVRDSIYTGIELGVASEEDLADSIAELETLEAMMAGIGDMPDEEAQNTQLPMLGGSAYYWKEMAAHPFEVFVPDLSVPVLVMQAGRDFQVRADIEYPLMQEVLKGHDDVTFKLYDGLNHLFMSSSAVNFVEHANEILTTTGHVSTQPLQDIVDWIASLRSQ